MKARDFFKRAAMMPTTLLGQVQNVTLDSATGQQTGAAVLVGGQTVSIALDALAPRLGLGDVIRLEQHGSAAAAEYRLVGVTSGAQVLSGVTQAMTAGATIAGVTYGAGDVIVGSLTGGNLLIEYATGNIYHRIGSTVYGIEYADGSQVFGEHELVGAVWTPVGYNVLIEADGIGLRSEDTTQLRIDANWIRMDAEILGGDVFTISTADGNGLFLTGLASMAGFGSDVMSKMLNTANASTTLALTALASNESAEEYEAGVVLHAEEALETIGFEIATNEIARVEATGLLVNDKVMLTLDGGLAVKVVAGESLSRGNVVYVKMSGGADGKVWKTLYSDGEAIQMPTGIVYADAAADAAVWIVTSGIAYALPESGITAARGNVVVVSNAESGRLEQSATAPVAEHWRECGHWLDTGSGNGALCRLLIHFN